MTKVDTTADVSLRATRALSRILFGGAQYRLEIAVAIETGDRGFVSTTGLAERLGIVRQTVHQELQLLERAGLLTRMHDDPSARVVFNKEESLYWKWCLEAHDNAIAMLAKTAAY